MIPEIKPDASWTLFLDRDGVINEKIKDDYVRTWEQFRFLPGSREAISELSKIFGRIIILTNQRGIARGFYTESDLVAIHAEMLTGIHEWNGRVDDIFFCPHQPDDPACNCRKPKVGMALQAKKKYPDIDFSRSVLVGDSSSDIKLGKHLGMHTILISDAIDDIEADYIFSSLMGFSSNVTRI